MKTFGALMLHCSIEDVAMGIGTGMQFSHVKPGDTQFLPGGLRDFFLYRDLGVAAATNGKVIAASCTRVSRPW